MAGITSYGAYIPWYRINRKHIAAAFQFYGATPSRGERSVANVDEDPVTMASEAATACIEGRKEDKIDALYFASTSQPFLVRKNAAIVAGSLDLTGNLRTADFTTCTKAGTDALLAAFDAVKAGSAQNVLVCASEAKMVKPNSPQEQLYGDGAAALMVGNDDVIATFEGGYSVSDDFPGRWKWGNQKYENAWEDRFIRDAGYGVLVPQAIDGLMKQCKIQMKDVAKLVFCYPYTREHAALAQNLGAAPEQVQDTMLETVGDTGAAYPLLMFIAALENAKPGDKIIVASFGAGSDALLFQVTEKIAKMKNQWGVRKSLARRKELTSWTSFACSRNVIPVDLGRRWEPENLRPAAMSYWWRDRKMFLSCYGARCKKCGTPQYPQRQTCANPKCGAIDQFEPYRFADKKGKVFVYIIDNNSPEAIPPLVTGAIDFEGGGRGYFGFADWEPEQVKVGQPCMMRLRIKQTDQIRGIPSYVWKAVPVRD